MRSAVLTFLILGLLACFAFAQEPFLTKQQWNAIRNESSGAAPYENLRYLTGLHRVPATADFDQAAQFVLERAKDYGLSDVHAEQFATDGVKQYGLMRSYFAWNVEQGSLWEVRPDHVLLGDWKTDPIRLADYSRTADAETALVDVGNGASEGDYSGKEVRGKIVLADGVLSRVQELAIAKHGAVGILSDMPNQTTAWSGQDPSLVRWGHLDARQPSGFAFMISRQEAETVRTRMRAGEQVILNAHVKATVGPGHWTVVTGTIPGADSRAGEVVYSCHLDHERPGANDNGSGCVAILESARVLARLIGSGTLPRPQRTLRFVWGPEVEGTMAFLASHPEIKQRLRADIHMDMVGGDPFKNKSVFHVTGTPWSLPSFVTDVGAEFLRVIREAASEYAGSGGSLNQGIIENRVNDGTRNEFFADVTPYSAGSDHDDYDSSTIGVPSLYLRDWPDIYIHTNHDSLVQIDATKLRRVSLLGAAAGYVYATLDAQQVPALIPFFAAQSEYRLAQVRVPAQALANSTELPPEVAWYEARNLIRQALERETGAVRSLVRFTSGPTDADSAAVKTLNDEAARLNADIDRLAKARGAKGAAPVAPWEGNADARRVPVRTGDFGPLTYQNDNVLLARLGKERYRQIKLLNSEATPLLNVQDRSELYAYETVNFIDGKRTVGEIRDAISAEFGPVPVELVADYLKACAEANVIRWK